MASGANRGLADVSTARCSELHPSCSRTTMWVEKTPSAIACPTHRPVTLPRWPRWFFSRPPASLMGTDAELGQWIAPTWTASLSASSRRSSAYPVVVRMMTPEASTRSFGDSTQRSMNPQQAAAEEASEPLECSAVLVTAGTDRGPFLYLQYFACMTKILNDFGQLGIVLVMQRVVYMPPYTFATLSARTRNWSALQV